MSAEYSLPIVNKTTQFLVQEDIFQPGSPFTNMDEL